MATGCRREMRPHDPQAHRSTALPAAVGPPATFRASGAAPSARDRELLGHLARGRSTGQIAAAMSVTPNTVRTRIRRVQRKLGLDGRDRVAWRARALGLV